MTSKTGTSRRSHPSRARESFDADYYSRFYTHPATRVRRHQDLKRLSDFVLGYMAHLGIPVRRVLDLGCGLGSWRAPLIERMPLARYTGVEHSDYLCRTLGWEKGSAADYRGRGAYDLVICQSVLQYLSDAEVRAAVANLARLCRGAVYLEIITAEDWRNHCDQRLTDGAVHLRPEAWYRRILQKHFRSAGGGLFLPLDSPVVLYELEKGGF